VVKHPFTPSTKSDKRFRGRARERDGGNQGRAEAVRLRFFPGAEFVVATANECKISRFLTLSRWSVSFAPIFSKQHVTESIRLRNINRRFTVTDKPNIYRAI
jgi:hypothetical protein